MATEHGVYVCTWKRDRGGKFTIWVKSRPQLRGIGATYVDAEEELLAAIPEAGGAIQAVLEFDPPLPKSTLEAKYSNPELYLIGGDDRFEVDEPGGPERQFNFKWADDYFVSPICRTCACASSLRSDKPLPLRYAPPRFDGAFGHAGRERSTLRIFSAGFLELLTPDEKRRLELREVIRKGRGRTFHELMGPAGPPPVAVSGLPVSGWRCQECGHLTWGYWVEGMSINGFIARSDLPHPLPALFTVGIPPEVSLCVTADRWKQLVGRNGTRGMTSRLLGVVRDHEVVRCPTLPTLEERLRE